mmetsp:Transcript_31727/g.26749  ORF Transcript_31727/g.26749 Transcript_31727/m.26749 type:complete len:116 (-) Transcript_31727:166-513(-)
MSDKDKERLIGNVKWFDPKKGYGFVVTDDKDKTDVFVHQSQLKISGFRSLAEGQKVEYFIDKDEKERLIAKDVTGPEGVELSVQKSYGNRGDRGGSRGGDRGRGFSRGRGDSRGG